MSFEEDGKQFVDSYLAHFGVKGMHWGVRRDLPSSGGKQAELADINRQIQKLNSERIITGEELRGWALKKNYKRQIRKNPNFKVGKLSPEEKDKYHQKATNKATRALLIRGVFETSVVLGGAVAIGRTGLSPEATRGAQISTILLAGKMGSTRANEIRAVRTAEKFRKLDNRRDVLLKKPPKKKL
jgi:hypothetical protein